MKKLAKFFGYTEDRAKRLEAHFQKHPGKTYIFGKLAHGVGGAILVAAGMARVNFWNFLWWNTLATIPKTLILLSIGFYAGASYASINKYLGNIAYLTLGLAVFFFIVYIIIQKYAKKSLAE